MPPMTFDAARLVSVSERAYGEFTHNELLVRGPGGGGACALPLSACLCVCV